MKIGLALPHYDFSFPDGRPARVGDVASTARRAEDAGFDSVWVSDHLFLSLERYGGPAGRQQTPDAFTMCAAIAAATTRVRIGTLVLCVPFRNPVVMAQQVRSLQDLSGGRFVAGLGAGWYEAEFAEAGIAFDRPGARIAALEDAASVIRAEAPVWIGGKGGPKIAGVVARAADGWNVVWSMTPAVYAERLATLRSACADNGRAVEDVGLSLGLTAVLATDEDDLAARYARLQAWAPPGVLDGTPLDRARGSDLTATLDDAVQIVKTYEALGVDEMILSLARPLPFAVFEDEQIDLAARLIEAVR